MVAAPVVAVGGDVMVVVFVRRGVVVTVRGTVVVVVVGSSGTSSPHALRSRVITPTNVTTRPVRFMTTADLPEV